MNATTYIDILLSSQLHYDQCFARIVQYITLLLIILTNPLHTCISAGLCVNFFYGPSRVSDEEKESREYVIGPRDRLELKKQGGSPGTLIVAHMPCFTADLAVFSVK
jgi:hypothetical protein